MAAEDGIEGIDSKGIKGWLGNELLLLRTRILRGRLLSRALEAHSRFTRQLGDDSFDPIELQTWHHNFRVHELEVIPTATLKDKPLLERQSTVTDFLRKNDIKQQLLDAAMKSVSSQGPHERGPSTGILSSMLLDKVHFTTNLQIKAREKAVVESKQILTTNKQISKERGESLHLMKLAETLKAIFATNNVVSMLFANVVAKLQDTDRGVFMSAGINVGNR